MKLASLKHGRDGKLVVVSTAPADRERDIRDTCRTPLWISGPEPIFE